MRFLARAALWLGMVLLLLPASPPERGAQARHEARDEAVPAPGGTMWTRGAEACVTFLHDVLANAFGRDRSGGMTAGADPPLRTRTMKSPHGTLTPADLVPAWRGPAQHHEAETKHPA